MAERGEGKKHSGDAKPEGAGPSAAEAAVALWAIGLMGYFYYAKGYPELLGQIWRLFFG